MATRSRDGTVLETKKSRVKPPPLFKVILLNDDYTPMEFVVLVLQTFFAHDPGEGDPGHAEGASGRHGSLRGLPARRRHDQGRAGGRRTHASTSIRCSA